MPTCVFTLCAWQLGRRMPAGAVMLQVEVAARKSQQPQQPDDAGEDRLWWRAYMSALQEYCAGEVQGLSAGMRRVMQCLLGNACWAMLAGRSRLCAVLPTLCPDHAACGIHTDVSLLPIKSHPPSCLPRPCLQWLMRQASTQTAAAVPWATSCCGRSKPRARRCS